MATQRNSCREKGAKFAPLYLSDGIVSGAAGDVGLLRTKSLFLWHGDGRGTKRILGYSEENGKVVGAETVRQTGCISANPEEHIKFAQQYIDLGFNQLFFHSAGLDQQSFLKGYGRDVLPQLRQVGQPRANAVA